MTLPFKRTQTLSRKPKTQQNKQKKNTPAVSAKRDDVHRYVIVNRATFSRSTDEKERKESRIQLYVQQKQTNSCLDLQTRITFFCKVPSLSK